MNPDLSKKAKNKVESLCGLGCKQVKQLLEKAKNGDDIEELSKFSRAEASQIVAELGEIMSVYDTDNIENSTNFK